MNHLFSRSARRGAFGPLIAGDVEIGFVENVTRVCYVLGEGEVEAGWLRCRGVVQLYNGMVCEMELFYGPPDSIEPPVFEPCQEDAEHLASVMQYIWERSPAGAH